MSKLEKGVNDLETFCRKNQFLDLLEEWDYEKNAPLTPDNICMGSGKMVWWKCSKGHEFEKSPNSRTNRTSGCPYCANYKILRGYNDLATTNPDIAAEWNYEKNDGLTPDVVGSGSGIKVWWKCSKGHEWKALITSRTGRNHSGCPYCSNKKVLVGYNDLMSTEPELCKEWDYEKNTPLTPQDVTIGSGKLIWWKCSEGHEWRAYASNRRKGIGCPYCSGRYVIHGINDLMTTNPKLCKEWNYEKNKELRNKQGRDISTPDMISSNSNQKVWWICEYGHEWKASVTNRTKGRNCPFCSNAGSSMPEQGIAYYLEKVCKVEQRIRIGGEEIDIYLPDYKIGIEYDGAYYHIGRESQENKKNTKLMHNGIFLIRIKESDVNSIEDDTIIRFNGDGINSNYSWALKALFDVLCKKTKNNVFESIIIDIESDMLKIRERFSLYRKNNSLANCHPELISEWNTNKNGKLKPEMFASGSCQKVWWICEFGHEWKTTILSRTQNGTGCPYCSNRKVLSGYNDLATINPKVAKDWHSSKNGDLRPSDVTVGSNKKVWWECSKGHEWQATVAGRLKSNGCPYCSNRYVVAGETDLVTTHPLLVKEWNYEKNKGVTDKFGRDVSKPDKVSAGSDIKVWWKCSEGHEWTASIINRANGGGCPYCSGKKILIGYNDLATTNPDIAAEWNYEKNGSLTPKDVVVHSNKKVWWKCIKGHEWETTVSHRTEGTRCPYCYGGISKPVLCVETGIIYTNMTDAVKATGAEKANIVYCCKGKRKTAAGFHWRYVDDD